MIIREAEPEGLGEITALYEMMCRELDGAAFLPNGDKGRFPLLEMVTEAIKNFCLYVGEENGEIAAAYIMNNECALAYDAVPWRVDADKSHVSILNALRVASKCIGMGYAGKFVEHAAETARQKPEGNPPRLPSREHNRTQAPPLPQLPKSLAKRRCTAKT